jgi:hypothetical protein
LLYELSDSDAFVFTIGRRHKIDLLTVAVICFLIGPSTIIVGTAKEDGMARNASPRRSFGAGRDGGRCLLPRRYEQSYCRWRKEYGGMKLDQARRTGALERESARLRETVSDLTFDKLILPEAARGNYWARASTALH